LPETPVNGLIPAYDSPQPMPRNISNSHYGPISVIPAWMPESSAMDGDMSVA